MAQILSNKITINKELELSKYTIELYHKFSEAALTEISTLRMKRNKNNISLEICTKYMEFML